ncbi:MAG: hypothetical protein CMN32_06080 [Saprospirales bacterium]|nr:hypothetical protein [Saprospirales bacterium]
MKNKLILLLFTTLMTNLASAQHSDETLFSKSHRSGFFFAPLIEYSDFNKEVSTSFGGGLAFISGDFFIGAYGLGMAEWDDFFLDDEPEQLDLGHGGLWLGYTFQQHEVLHLFTSVKAGWGVANVDFSDDEFNFEDGFMVFTPEAGLEVNVARWFRIAGTAGYRFINGLDPNLAITEKDLEGFTGTITFRMGWFGRHRVVSRYNR